MKKASFIAATAVLSGVGVVGYLTYKHIENRKRRTSDSGSSSSSLESFYTADYRFYTEEEEELSDTEYFSGQEEWSDGTEEVLLYEKVDKLMKGGKRQIEAACSEMERYFEVLSERPNFLWRYAKVHHLKGKVEKREAQRLNNKGLIYAEKALDKDPENPDAHKWFAILKGMEAEFLQDRVKKVDNAKIFFKHIQKALMLRPEDWEVHHLLGIFEYKLANLSVWEKPFARMFFKDVAEFEYGEAIKHFKTAEKHNSDSMETKLYLAKCFYAEKHFKKALKYLNEALEMKVESINDKACQQEARELIHIYEEKV